MGGIKFHQGDIFLAKNPMYIGKAINAVQSFYSHDNASVYSHAGIIIDTSGTTFEALRRVGSQSIYKGYAGERVMVARCRRMSKLRFNLGYNEVQKRKGQIYPGWRLLFHLFGPVAKYVHFGRVVCSELVAEFLKSARVFNSGVYGQTPDSLDDLIRNSKDWDIIFEGTLENG